MTKEISTVGVVGFGAMGAGIAQVAAAAGSEVVVLDTTAEAIEAGLGRLRSFLDIGVKRGKVTESDAAALLGRITTSIDATALASCDLVIESATEDRIIKHQVLATVSSVIAADAIVASNTSSLSITALAAAVAGRNRFVGLHFFNPAPLMPLLEVIPGLETDDSTVAAAMAWARSVGKEPVVAKDQPGFLVNSLFMPYINQAITEYDDGLASGADIDTAIRLGLGYPKGPLELLDLIGLDTHLHATSRAFEDTADTRYAPPPLLRRLVAAGRLGHKSGSGIREERR